MKAIYKTKSPEETLELGKRLAYRLMGGEIILLYGELGAGKTQLTKGIAEGLGITATIKSPTFTYVNQFPISNFQINHKSQITNQKFLHHYDLYRLNQGDDFASVGLMDSFENPSAITVVEWAERLGGYLPKNNIQVRLEDKKTHHQIEIIFHDSEVAPLSRLDEFYDEWLTPLHVRAHCAQVAKVAMQVAEAFIQQGEIIDLNLIYTSALLHDVTRVCDFKTLDKKRFDEAVTDKKWKRWEDLRKTHQGFHHADIAKKFFIEIGYPKTAEAIFTHKSTMIVTEPERLNTLEKKLIYYADKRVKHDEVVTLTERFRDGKERYGKYNDDDETRLFDEVERATFQLEKELLEGLSIKPADIK